MGEWSDRGAGSGVRNAVGSNREWLDGKMEYQEITNIFIVDKII